MTKVLAVLLAVAGTAGAAEDARLTATVGTEYSTGSYGQDIDTSILAVSFAAKYEVGRWTLRGSVPWLRISGPDNVVATDAGGVILPGSGERRTESGLGDLVLAAAYLVMQGPNAPFNLDVGGKVKLPTADEDKGLGTGEADYSVQAEAFKPLGAFTPFATLGYRHYGDPPGLDLRNVLYGSLGSAYRLSQQASVGAAYDFRDRIIDGGARLSEVSAFLSHRYRRDVRAQLYAVFGLADASPDAAVGVTLSYSF
jgi:hypothetical protein